MTMSEFFSPDPAGQAPSAEPSESLSGDGVQGKAAECKGTVAGVWRKAHGGDFKEGERLFKPSAEHPPNEVRYWVQDLGLGRSARCRISFA